MTLTYDKARDQVFTAKCPTEHVMRHRNFALGLADIRGGVAFNDMIEDDYWAYERGRLFGCLAPKSMPLFVGGKLNRKAVVLFDLASDRGLIL
jgi:hypothetical protein